MPNKPLPNKQLPDSPLPRAQRVVSWVAQVGVAVILGQTLFFKLTYAPETQYIFESLGGRPAATFAALVELAAVVLLLVPRTAALGGAVALGVISGAIATHLGPLGIEVLNPETGEGDGGFLFVLALIVFGLSATVVAIRRAELPVVGARFRGEGAVTA